MFNSFLDGCKPSIESTAVSNATGLGVPSNGLLYPPASVEDIPFVTRPTQRRRRARAQGHGRGDLLARGRRPHDPLRHPHGRVGHGRGRDRLHPQLLRGIQRPHRPERALLHAVQALAPDRPGSRPVGGQRGAARRGHRRGHRLERRRRGHRQARPAGRARCSTAKAATRCGASCCRRPRRRAIGGLPLGLAHDVKLLRPVQAGPGLCWDDVAIDTGTDAYRLRREMEALFAPVGARPAALSSTA